MNCGDNNSEQLLINNKNTEILLVNKKVNLDLT